MNPGLDIFKNAQRLQGGTGQLAEGKAPWDYFNPFGGTTKGGSNTGVPTQKFVGTAVGTASNLLIPGSGFFTGPISRWITSMIQHGLSRNQATKVAQGYVAGGGQSGDTTSGATGDATGQASSDSKTPSAGIGIDPYGNPADPGEFWSNDFGRWGEGDQYGTTPGNYNPPGPGGGIGTRGVWGGQTTIPIQSDPNFVPSLGWAMPAASGGGAYGGNTMAKIALHSGRFRNAATPEQWNFMKNYLGGGGGGGGSGQGVGGAGRPMTQSQQMGTNDVNPGLKLFHGIQKRKKK